MRYAKVENNEVVKVFKKKPEGGLGSYSTLGDDFPDSQLISEFSIYPVEVDAAPAVHDFQGLDEVVTIEPTRVHVSYSINNVPIKKKKAAIARASKNYIEDAIDPSLSFYLAIGVQNGGVKSRAVAQWVDDVITESRARRQAVTETSVVDTDFSPLGDPPFPMPQIVNEVRAIVQGLP